MTTQLPLVRIDGKHYYQDDRLREYRLTTNPGERITFDELGDRQVELVEPKKELTKKFRRKIR